MSSRKFSVCLNDTDKHDIPLITKIKKDPEGHSSAIRKMLLESSAKPNPSFGAKPGPLPDMIGIASDVAEILGLVRAGSYVPPAAFKRLDELDSLCEQSIDSLDGAILSLEQMYSL